MNVFLNGAKCKACTALAPFHSWASHRRIGKCLCNRPLCRHITPIGDLEILPSGRWAIPRKGAVAYSISHTDKRSSGDVLVHYIIQLCNLFRLYYTVRSSTPCWEIVYLLKNHNVHFSTCKNPRLLTWTHEKWGSVFPTEAGHVFCHWNKWTAPLSISKRLTAPHSMFYIAYLSF